MIMYRNKEYQHPEYDLTVVERYLGRPYTANEYVEIPHTHTGYGASALEFANARVIKNDPEMITRLNLYDRGHAFGSHWVAIVDDYTDEQWRELEELVVPIRDDYPILDESIYDEVDHEMTVEYLEDCISYEDADAGVTGLEVLYALHDMEIYVEADGDSYYLPEEDFEEAVKRVKNQLVAA